MHRGSIRHVQIADIRIKGTQVERRHETYTDSGYTRKEVRHGDETCKKRRLLQKGDIYGNIGGEGITYTKAYWERENTRKHTWGEDIPKNKTEKI